LDLSGLEEGPVAVSCEHMNEPSISIKFGELRNLQRLDWDIAPSVINLFLNDKRASCFVKIIINETACLSVLIKLKLTN
jgi:hypothetical protein